MRDLTGGSDQSGHHPARREVRPIRAEVRVRSPGVTTPISTNDRFQPGGEHQEHDNGTLNDRELT
jgi:hypothetical protein